MAAGTVVDKAFCNHDRVKLWLAILSLYQNTSCFDTTNAKTKLLYVKLMYNQLIHLWEWLQSYNVQ